MSYGRNNKYVDKSSSVNDSDGNRYMEPWGKLGLKYAPHYYHSQSVADSSSSVDTTNEPFSKQLRRGFQQRKIAIILFVIGLIAITAAIIPILVITLRPAESHPDKIRVVTMKLSVDAIFKPEYYDKSSLEYQSFEANFSAAIGLLYSTGSIKGYNGLQIQELRNGSVIVIFIIVIEVKQNQDLPSENELKAIITEQPVDAGDQNFVSISNFRIQKTSVTVESVDESENNPLPTKRTTSTTTSTSTSTTTPTTTSTTSTNTKQGTTSTTSSSTSATTPTKASTTSPATVYPSTTSTTSSSTSAATTSTTSTTSPTTVNPSTTSITSTSTSTTIPTTTTTTSTTMKPSTTSITSTSTSTTMPTTTTTASTTMKPSTTSITLTSTSTTIPTTTATTSTTMKPSTTSITSTSTSTTMPTTTTTTTTSTTMKPSTTSITSTSTSTTMPTTTTTTSTTMKPSTTSITSTSTSTTIPTTTTTTSTTMKPSTTSITSTSTSTTMPTTTTTTSTTMKPSTTSITSTSTSTTIPTTTTTTSTTAKPSTTSTISTSTSTTSTTTITKSPSTVNPSTTITTPTSTSSTTPTTTSTTPTATRPGPTSTAKTLTSSTTPTTISTTSTTANPCTTCTTSASIYTTIMNPSNTSTTFTSTSSTTPTTASTTATTSKQSTASTTSTSRYTETPGTTSAASSTNAKLITNITTSTSTTTSPTIAEPITTSTIIATSTSTTISTATSTAYQPPTKPSTTSTDSTSATITLTATASTEYPPTTKASTSSSETTTAATTVDKTMSTNQTMMTTIQQPTTTPALDTKTEIYFGSNLYSGFVGSFVRLTCQAIGMSQADLQIITIKRSSTSSGTEFVASISVNGTKSSDFQDISIRSESIMNSSKAMIHLDFHKLACADNGTYYCIAGNYSATGELNIYRKPERPVLTFPLGVLENQKETFDCSGEVGYPPGTIVLETNNGDGKTFVKAPFSSTSNVIHGNCSAIYKATFSFNFTLGWNNTIVRCKVEKSQELNDNETSPYVDKILLIVPANICGTSNTLYVPHPYDCHKYIQCGMQTYLRNCPAGLCRFTQPHNETYCERTCDTCTAYQTTEHTTVRTTHEDTTTSALQTTITTSGNTTIPNTTKTENTSQRSTIGITTTERVSDKTNASTTITTPIPSEVYFTSTSYSAFMGSSIRLTCQVQTISPAYLKAITIKRNSTSSGTQFVASISTNGTKSSDFQDISISSENFMNSSKVTIHVDFHKLACTDEGTYYCMTGDVFATGSLNILKKPEKPILTFLQGVLENSQQDMFNCTGEVGHPPGNIVFETNKDDVKTFIRAPFTPATNVIHGNCSATYSATFSYKFTMDWNNTIIRCRAENSKALDDNETSPYVDKTLLIIQANICGTSNTLYVPHPYDCHKYIQCGMQTYLRDCPAGLCRFTQPHNQTYCERTCDNCTAYQISESTTVRMTPEEKTISTFQTTITTSGNKTISISNRIENQTSTYDRVLTTTANVSDQTVSSTTVTTAIYTEIYFTSTSYSGYIGSSIRLTCQVQQISSAALQSITIKRSFTSSGTQFVASISVNGTKSSDFQDISISSENFMNSSKVTIHVDFHKLACTDEGTYYCMIGNVFATGSLKILKKPEKPVLTFPQGVLENSQQDMFNCTGEVGHPPGNIVFETNKDDVKTFIRAPFTPATNVIHGNCSATYSATFSYKFTMDWNNTIIRCRAENSKALDDNETSPYVDKTLLIIQANICGTSNTLYVPHPYDCHKYIQCGMQTYLRDCPAGLCRFTQPHNQTYCERTCDNCTAYQISESTTVRMTPEEKTISTFQTTITTSGNKTISISNRIENQTSTYDRVLTTTANVSDQTVSSTTVTTAIYTEIYFTSTSYSGYIGSSIRLTCQVQQISSAALQSITIKRSFTSSGTQFVASISVNGTKSSDFQDISISSENFMNSSKVTIHVDFHKLACTDEGTYYCMTGDVFATGSLNILKKPEKPILTFPQGVLENSQQDMFNCTGEVGHPPGNIVFETNKDDVKTFIRAPFTPATNVIHGNCNATYSATFSYKFTMDWNNTIIRCRAENSKALDDNETSPYVDKKLFIVPANICETSNTLYVPHPYDCHKYIQCGMQTYLRDCPAGLCRFTQPHNQTYCERTCDNCTVSGL